jgi:hypothetical protein
LCPIKKNAQRFFGHKKLWVEHGVGASEATDLAMRNPEPPSGGEAHTVLLGAGFSYFIYHFFYYEYYRI